LGKEVVEMKAEPEGFRGAEEEMLLQRPDFGSRQRGAFVGAEQMLFCAKKQEGER